VDEAVVEKASRGRARRGPNPTSQGTGVHLDESSRLYQAGQALRRGLYERVALRMRKHRGDTLCREGQKLLGEVSGPAVVRELEESELALAPERERTEHLLVEAFQLVERDLGALDDIDRDASRSKSDTERLQALFQLSRCRRIPRRHMRRCREHAYPGRCESPRELEALLQCRGSVVEGRQNVGVQVDRPRDTRRQRAHSSWLMLRPTQEAQPTADTPIMVEQTCMRRTRRLWIAPVSVAAALTIVVPSLASSQKPLERQTKRQAELTLLRASKALAALSPRLVDPRTRLVRTNTRVICKGLGRAQNGMFVRFRCVIANGNARFLVSYVAFGQDGKTLRKIATLAPG
jgi:hypothetical protein